MESQRNYEYNPQKKPVSCIMNFISTTEVMNIIYEKTGVKYHEVHIYRLLHKWKFSPKIPRKRFVNTASDEEKKQFKKRLRK